MKLEVRGQKAPSTNGAPGLRRWMKGFRFPGGWHNSSTKNSRAVRKIASAVCLKPSGVANSPNSSWIFPETQVKATFQNRILPVDMAVAECCAHFLNLRTRGLADALIAATAKVHDLTLATRNTANFADTGIQIINPWSSSPLP